MQLATQIHSVITTPYNQMKGAQIAQTLSRTLNHTTLNQASRELQSMRERRGFTVELLVVTDSSDYLPAVRQSAVIYLKNAVQDHCSKRSFIAPEDLTDLKANLLEAIIRNVNNNQIAPTLREVVFQMAEKYYPRQWPQIVEEALSRVTTASEFHEILGCVEALRAVFLVFGGSVVRDIQLGNLCNRAILPLLGLASRLFQNFNQETSTILLSVLKLFSSAIQFHLPAIIAINIHNLMIFVKKVLDLDLPLEDGNACIYYLKKTCLRLLFRLYQKHVNPKITQDKVFAQNFHAKYTLSFVETLVYQVIADIGKEKSSRRRYMELMRMSLSCLAYVNRQSADAAILLMQHRESLIGFCLQRLKLNFSKTYQSFVDFRVRIQENRAQLKEFFFSLMQCEAVPDQQSSAVAALLGLLLNWLQTGDGELKELALYIYAEMSTELQFLKTSVEENMTLLVVTYVRPLLVADQPVLVRMRACNLLASYNYLDLPEGVLVELATSVYNCLLANGGEKESYLRIYACNAFNGLLKYPSIVDFVRPHLQDILRIYTSLLEADVSIIKNFEDLLNLLEEEIAPFANDLVLLLTNLFANYARQDSQGSQLSQGNSGEESDHDDEESLCQEDDSNNESIAKACISSIRQILQAQGAQLSGKVREDLLGIVLGVFAERSQMYIEEGYNILNLLLYKLQGPPEEAYYLFFKAIAYAILGLPPNFLQQLQRGTHFQQQYADILQNICVQPDNDLLENSIGCLRNFIAKSPPQVLYGYRDEFGNPFIETLFRIVQQVHENEGGRHSQTDRLIVLTIYVTLVEYRVLEEKELSRVVSQILGWMQMEQEAVAQQGGQASLGKFVYSAVYLQIVLLAIHSYGRTVINQLNLSSLLQRLLELQGNFKCDYQLARVLIGVADLLQLHAISDQSIANALMQSLPDLICRACRLRQEGDNPLNDIDMDDQAEQERLLGCDENSMMLGWQQKGASDKDLQLQEDDDDDNDWEEEFNKFYDSPLDKIDEIKWLENVLKGEGSPYCALLSTQEQEQLSLYFTNAPPKQ